MPWLSLFKQRPNRPLILGVLNASPESFHSGSVAEGAEAVAARASAMQEAGADALDIGGKSTAPYLKTDIPEELEAERLVAAVRAARSACSLPISADTTSAEVARRAIEAGADCINDVSGLRRDGEMANVIAKAGCGAILMARENEAAFHEGEEPAAAVGRLLAESLDRADRAGIPRGSISLDPGLGFFRGRAVVWHSWDVALLRSCREFRHRFGLPIVVGASRKSFIGALLGRPSPEDRLAGSLAVAVWCALEGVDMLRVHDVRETSDALRMVELLESAHHTAATS